MKLQFVAVFLIVLVLGIPLYSAKVYGDTLDSASASGGDSVEGYRKKTDTTHFEAIIFGEDIDAGSLHERVHLEAEGGYDEPFDSCLEEATGYLCKKDIVEEEWDIDSYTFPVRLYSDQMEPMGTEYASLTIDNSGPQISSFTADKNKASKNDSLELSYTVQDTAYSGCSGLDYVELFANSESVLERDIDTGSCTYSDTFEINLSGYSEGDLILALKAYDLLGHESGFASYDVEIDNSGPQIIGSLNLTEQNGEPLVYVPQNGINVKASVFVAGGDFKEIRAQFTELNPSYSTYGEFIKGECEEQGDNYYCEWDVNVDVEETTTADVYFEVEDEVGNVNEVSLPYSLKVDTTAPVLNNIETSYGGHLIGKKTTFTAVLSETGSGFDNKDIFLNLASIGASTTDMRPDSCNAVSGGWRCYWYNITVPDNIGNGEVYVNAMPSSMDDMGNYIEGQVEYNMTLDTAEPDIESIEIMPIAGAVGYPANITEPKTGDSLHVLVNLSDLTDVDATGDFTEVLLYDDVYSANCVGEDYKICEIETTEVREGPATGTIYFNFTDQTGNTLLHEEDLIIYGVENESFISERWYISNDPTGERMPEFIDAETTRMIEYKAYFPIEIRSKYSGYVVPVEVYDFECTNGSELLAEEPYLIANGGCPNCTNFYAVAPLGLADYEDFDLDCSFKIISLYGNVYERSISAPEEHNITLGVGFANTALGTLSDSMRDKVDAVKDSWLVQGKWIGSIQKVFDYAEGICKMINSLLLVSSTLNAAVVPFGWVPGIEVVAEALDKFFISTLSLQHIHSHFCGFLTCEGFFGWDWAENWQDTVSGWMTGELLVGENSASDFINKASSASPRDSLMMSVASLCLPGITYNLNKARQIDCWYIYCMEHDVPEGSPAFRCTLRKHYADCMFVWGEIFHVVPFTSLLDDLVQKTAQMLSNPWSLLIATVNSVCGPQPSTAKNACNVAKSANDILNNVDQILRLFSGELENYFSSGQDYCKKIEDEGYI